MGFPMGRLLKVQGKLFQGILGVPLGSSASSTFLSWNLLARSSMMSLSHTHFLSLVGVAARITLSDQNMFTYEL